MAINILNLNDDCIACILQYLPIDNHIKFAQVCQRFHHVWKDYRMLVYKRLELGATTSNGLDTELLILRQIAPHVKHLTVNLNRNFEWSEKCRTIFVNLLKKMFDLERVILWINDNEPYQTFEPILRSLEQLPNLKGVATYQDNEIVDILYQFTDFKEFLTESEMSRNPLIENIESHTKIRLLVLNNAPVHATLADLVQHTACIKELNFRLTQRPEEYTPLAKLPNLNKLQIFGNWLHRADRPNIMPLITAVSSNLSNKLHTLTIHVPILGYAETLQIVRIKGLQRLDCSFTDSKCLELMVQLKELTHLFALLPASQNIDSLFLGILESCRNLECVQIDSPNLSRNIIDKAFSVLQKIRDTKKKSPLILMLGNRTMTLDQETSKYLTVFW